MIVATLTKVLAGVALVGAVATTVLFVLPHPGSHNGIWLDTPLDDAVVEAGDVALVLHSDIAGITGIYVTPRLGGTASTMLRDDDLERVQRGAGAKPLSVFDQIWSVTTPGTYTLDVSVSGSTAVVRSFEVTVLEQGAVSVDYAEATPQPSSSPTPTPTSSAAAGPSGPLLAGTISRVQGADDWISTFTISGYSPVESTVIVEVRITDSINDVTADWQQYQCSNIAGDSGVGAEARYTCELQNHTLSPPSSFQIDGTWMPFSVEYRAAIYSGDEIVYADGGSWETERRSAN